MLVVFFSCVFIDLSCLIAVVAYSACFDIVVFLFVLSITPFSFVYSRCCLCA